MGNDAMARRKATDMPAGSGSGYPPPHDAQCQGREWHTLGDAFGLTQFGVKLLRLKPGVWSSQRHWHSHEDEFVYMLEGEATLVTDAGEEAFCAGDCVGFQAGAKDGHCIQNNSDNDAFMLVMGSRDDRDFGDYPDIDMKFWPGRYSAPARWTRKDGSEI